MFLQELEADIDSSSEVPRPDVEFIHGDLFDLDINPYSVVFVNSTCFDDRLMERIGEKVESMPPGAVVVTLTRHLPSSCFTLTEPSLPLRMSWGVTKVHFYQKDGDLPGPNSQIESTVG